MRDADRVKDSGSGLVAADWSRLFAKGADAEQVAEAIVSTWQEINAILSPVIGRQGVAALYQRSLYVTVAGYPWLRATQEGIQDSIEFAAMKSVLEQQGAASAAAGGGALLQAFYELLASMVGTSLTSQLLGPVWTSLSSTPPPQDSLS